MNFLAIVAVACSCASCVFLEDSCSLGRTRSEAFDGKQETESAEQADTIIYVCAVDVPENVDWQKDIAMGLGPGRLIFYKNNNIQFELKFGYENCVCSDADSHHIIEGHLITEFSQADKTIVKKDGKLLLEWQGREYLLGLCEKDNSVYTLSVDRGTGDLRYRKDGVLVNSFKNAYAFGSFQEKTYPETGALYLSGGKVCCCYAIKADNIVFYHIIKDGTDNQLVIGDDHYYYGIQDIRVVDGDIYAVSALATSGFMFGTISSARHCGGAYNWSSLRISVSGDKPMAFGNISDGGYYMGYGLVSLAGAVQTASCQDAVVFKGRIFDVSHEDCVHFSNKTAIISGGQLVEALTPKDMTKKPFLLKGRDTVKYNVHGYISGMAAAVSQSKSGFSSRQERR